MVGSKGSGNRQPSNNARLSLTSVFLDALASYPNPKGIPKDFQIALLALTNPDFKKHIIETQGQEVYDELIKRYNRNRTEMARDKNMRDKAKLEERKKKDAMREKDLELKEREIELQEKRLENRGDKKSETEIEDLTEQLFEVKEEIRTVEKMPSKHAQKFYKKEKKEVLQDLEIKKTTLEKRLEELGNG